MEQLTFFDIFETERPQFFTPGNDPIKKGDVVQIIKNNLDDEAINYFEYYKPAVLRSPGIIVEVLEKTFKLIYKNGEEIEIEKNNVKKEV